MTKRIFIGIPINSERVAQQAETWRGDRLLNQNHFSWTRPENWHLTLYFLGSTPENRLQLLNRIIDDTFRGLNAFSTELIGAGVFPNLRNPKVLWLGLKTLGPIMAAHAQLGELLRMNAFEFDPKPLKPHLTLARVKSLEYGVVFNSLLDKYEQFNFGQVSINQVVVFESILTSAGPVYNPLHRAWLAE